MSRRIERINEQLRAELAELIQRELKDPRLAGLISITQIDTAPDLRNARVYVSVLGSEEDANASLRALRSAAGFLRRALGGRLTLRNIPELHFVLDTSIERGERIMSLIRDIEHTTAQPNDDEGEAEG